MDMVDERDENANLVFNPNGHNIRASPCYHSALQRHTAPAIIHQYAAKVCLLKTPIQSPHNLWRKLIWTAGIRRLILSSLQHPDHTRALERRLTENLRASPFSSALSTPPQTSAVPGSLHILPTIPHQFPTSLLPHSHTKQQILELFHFGQDILPIVFQLETMVSDLEIWSWKCKRNGNQ